MPRSDRLGALLGTAGIAGNLLGVLMLGKVAGAYRPGSLGPWIAGSLAHPAETVASSGAFTLGLLALAGWAIALGRRVRGPLARAAAGAIAAGALLNAAGTLTPAVLVLHLAPACAGAGCLPAARALLGLTLALDALFNLLLGAGLAALGAVLAARRGRRAIGLLGLAAGLASIPVSLQIAWDWAARLLSLAAPLWLAFVAVTSALLWRGTPMRGRREGGGAHAAMAGSR